MAQWKGRWGATLYWRVREQREDAGRLQALTQLKVDENEALARELSAIKLAVAEQTQHVNALQTQLDARETALRDAQEALDARRRDKLALEAALAQSRAQVEAAGEERKRMRAVEEALASERVRDAEMLEARKREADGILSRLVAESAALRSEAEAAHAQAEEAERGAARGVEREEGLLGEALQTVAAMETLVRQREATASQLSLEQQHLDVELERVQRRLDDFMQDGAALASEGEGSLRQKASHLRLLRTDAGLAEARVAELRRIVLERKQQLGYAEVSKVLEGEERSVFFFTLFHTLLLFLFLFLFLSQIVPNANPSPLANAHFSKQRTARISRDEGISTCTFDEDSW